MKKLFAVAILLAGVLGGLNAQHQKGDVDVAHYPNVSFVWNDANPNPLDDSQFAITLNGEVISSQELDIEKEKPEAVKKGKTILFLWEDMPEEGRHKGQYVFTYNTLLSFIKTAYSEGMITDKDKFQVAFFGQKNADNQAIARTLMPDFTGDVRDLLHSLPKSGKPEAVKQGDNASADVYSAIDEGLAILQKDKSDNIKMLVVFSCGVSCSKTVSGKNDASDSEIIALRKHIPISLVEYNSANAPSNFSEKIVASTFGTHVQGVDYQMVFPQFLDYYSKVSQIHAGTDYRISFNSFLKADGQQHSFTLTVNDIPYTLTFLSPKPSFWDWVKANWILCVVLVVVFLLLIALLVVLLVVSKKRRRREAQYQRQLAQQQLDDEASKRMNMEAEMERQRQEELSRRRQIEEDRKRNEEKEKNTMLLSIMQRKNLYPRLNCIVEGKRFTYTIGTVETTLGRSDANQVVLPAPTVSKSHAKIVFNGNAFEIFDQGSTNKVKVNNVAVQRAALRGGEIINLGSATITFIL